MNNPLRILSLGAGVQSSTLALMAAHGEIEPIHSAIFADTQWEPKHVYDWLNWLEEEIFSLPHPFPIYRVTQGSLRQSVKNKKNTTGGRYVAVPFYVLSPTGKKGMGRRQCTSEFKLLPIRRKQRELVGLKKGQRVKKGITLVKSIIGISLDEASRMKPSTDSWAENVWPLVDLRMTRSDCIRWLTKKGYPVPHKSACLGCPFRNDHEWKEIKKIEKEWQDVVEIDQLIRDPANGFRGTQFIHRSMKPLTDVNLTDDKQPNLFMNECSGMCGI